MSRRNLQLPNPQKKPEPLQLKYAACRCQWHVIRKANRLKFHENVPILPAIPSTMREDSNSEAHTPALPLRPSYAVASSTVPGAK